MLQKVRKQESKETRLTTTVNQVIFVYENIHELNFRVNKLSWVPGPMKILCIAD